MTTERITFSGSRDAKLAARVDRPVHGEPRGWALFAHCFTCGKNLKPVVNISRALNHEGIGVLRFDFTGLGESEGDFADTNFSSNVEDLVAAARFMEERGEAPGLLVGHSLGGAAVLHAAHQLPSVKAVATIGAPADPSHVLKHMQDHEDEIRNSGEATVTLAGRPFRIRKQFLDDLEATRMEGAVRTLGRALMIFHSPLDEIVGIDNAARLFGYARHPRSFVSLDQADHLLLEEGDSRYVGTVIGSWASRYMELASQAPDPEEEVPIPDERVVVRTPSEGFRTDVWADGHYLVADEPRSLGGTEEGPTPYDLLAAGLGACTSMTLQMYARRKGWPLDEARAIIRHRKRHASDDEVATAEDGGGAGNGDPRLDRMERELQLIGDLNPEQRERLVEIANRCPVHRTLEAGVAVGTTLIDPPAETD
jgi:uncharacterized OsmC-like protein/alpha/beta superfamily hydrolase